MSKAIKLTKTDLAYLKFGGAAKLMDRLGSLRVEHKPLSATFQQIVPFDISAPWLSLGHDVSGLTLEQLNTLNILKRAAGDIGYGVKASGTPVSKNAGTKILLTNERLLTLDDIFGRPGESTKKLEYVKRKGNA